MPSIRRFYVYILTNKTRGLYIGMTNNLHRRMEEHKNGLVEGFAKKYRMDRLVYYQEFPTAIDAIKAEKTLKGWRREKKINLIEEGNPDWDDYAISLPFGNDL